MVVAHGQWHVAQVHTVDYCSISDAITSDAVPYGSQVAVYDAGGYTTAVYEEGVGGASDAWNQTSLAITAGEQFVFIPAENALDYHKWPYAYVGDWRMMGPLNPIIAGQVPIAWDAYDRFGEGGNPEPRRK